MFDSIFQNVENCIRQSVDPSVVVKAQPTSRGVARSFVTTVNGRKITFKLALEVPANATSSLKVKSTGIDSKARKVFFRDDCTFPSNTTYDVLWARVYQALSCCVGQAQTLV